MAGRRTYSKARARRQRGHERSFDRWDVEQEGARATEHARWKDQVTRELTGQTRGQPRKGQASR